MHLRSWMATLVLAAGDRQVDTGLIPGTTYNYRVAAYHASGTSIFSLSAKATLLDVPPQPPAAPSNLTVVSRMCCSIDLRWTDNSKDEAGFYIERAISSPSNQSWRPIATNLPNVTTWSDTQVVPFTNYYYRVSTRPEDQTDGLFRGPRVVWSVNEAIGGTDSILGNEGADWIIGGAGGDTVQGGLGDDIIAGDAARLDLEPVTGNDGATQLSEIKAMALGVGGIDTLSGNAGTEQHSATVSYELPPGTATFTMQAMRDSASGTQTANYCTLRIAPAFVPPLRLVPAGG